MVKVWPKSDAIRKLLKHPSNNVGFPENGPLEWPEDAFTHRRLEDGDVTADDPTQVRTPPGPPSEEEVVMEEPTKRSKR